MLLSWNLTGSLPFEADTVVGTLTNAFKKECFLLRSLAEWDSDFTWATVVYPSHVFLCSTLTVYI